jgi:CubicO group peptidase (beta-lactamase class C family)
MKALTATLKAASIKPATASGAIVEHYNQICVAIIAGVLLFVASIASTLAATVDEVVASELEKHGMTAVSLAIIENGKIIEAKAYGFTDKSKATAVTTNTLFQAGSVSKPVAALAALRLVEAGKLALDDNVNQFLKQWQVPENKFTKDQKVTLRRILSHSRRCQSIIMSHFLIDFNSYAPYCPPRRVSPAAHPVSGGDLPPHESGRPSRAHLR